jgi:hypothetical protein
MSLYYECSYPFPQVVALYVCRCGRTHTQHGVARVSKLPPAWHETSDLAEQPEPECPDCDKKTVARQKAVA